ncbi:MAG: Rid family detoxifying hydrolase [bacterium]
MTKVAISSDKAPKAAPFFSQAILTSSKYHLEISGQIGLDPQLGKLVEGGVAEQTEQIFTNLAGILSELGWSFENITKSRVFLTSMADYQAMNDVYAKKFSSIPPARLAVAVTGLPLGATVEIECIAEGDQVTKGAKAKYSL